MGSLEATFWGILPLAVGMHSFLTTGVADETLTFA